MNVCYCLDQLSLPLKGNYNPKMFKLYPILPYFPAEALDSECKLPIPDFYHVATHFMGDFGYKVTHFHSNGKSFAHIFLFNLLFLVQSDFPFLKQLDNLLFCYLSSQWCRILSTTKQPNNKNKNKNKNKTTKTKTTKQPNNQNRTKTTSMILRPNIIDITR